MVLVARDGALVLRLVLEVLVVVVLCVTPTIGGRTINLGWYSGEVSDVGIRTRGVTM